MHHSPAGPSAATRDLEDQAWVNYKPQHPLVMSHTHQSEGISVTNTGPFIPQFLTISKISAGCQRIATF